MPVCFSPAASLLLVIRCVTPAAARVTVHDPPRQLTAQHANKTVRLQDICFRPLYPDNPHCMVQSLTEYFQEDATVLNYTAPDGDNDQYMITYLDHIRYCLLNPTEITDADFNLAPCMSKWGGPTFPYMAVGGFLSEGQTLVGNVNYLNASALLVTFLVNNQYDHNQLGPAMAWEQA